MKENAIIFLNWCADNGWYRNGKRDEWYQLQKQNTNKNSAELYDLFKSTAKQLDSLILNDNK